MRRVHDLAGDPPLRRRPAGFEGLARIIVGQQVSVASATAIWDRTAVACRPVRARRPVGPAGHASRRRRPVAPEDPHAARDRLGLPRRPRSCPPRRHQRRGGARRLDRGDGHRPLDGGRLHYVLPGPRRRLGAGRPRPADRRPARPASSPSGRTPWRCWSSPSAGAPGAASPPACCGPTTPPSRPSAPPCRCEGGGVRAHAASSNISRTSAGPAMGRGLRGTQGVPMACSAMRVEAVAPDLHRTEAARHAEPADERRPARRPHPCRHAPWPPTPALAAPRWPACSSA